MSVPPVWRVSPPWVCALAPVLAASPFPSVVAPALSLSRCWCPPAGSLLLSCVAPGVLFLWVCARHLALFLASLPRAFPLPLPFLVSWPWGGGEVFGTLMAYARGWVVWSHRRRVWRV